MTNWADRAAAALISLSRAKTLAEAMREWNTTGGYEDTHNIEEICELCSHEGLRYQYEIENRITTRTLWVGSTCITRFVPLFENGVEVIGEEAKASVLRRRQAAHEAQSREYRAFGVLDRLAKIQPDPFRQTKWRTTWKLGYSARQLLMIAAASRRHGVPFSAADFRINTRRGHVAQQVRDLEPWQYRRLRGALPPSRHGEFDAFFLTR